MFLHGFSEVKRVLYVSGESVVEKAVHFEKRVQPDNVASQVIRTKEL